jgi:hypothetical protein
VEENDSEVGALVLRLRHEAAVHVGVAAGLVHEEPADGIEVLQREAALLQNRAALERRHAAGDYPERLAGGVVVDGLD